MKQKKGSVYYLLDDYTQEKIKKHCIEVLDTIASEFLEENDIPVNELLEYLYLGSKKNYEYTGNYELSEDQITFLLYIKKQSDKLLEELQFKRAVFVGINKGDDIVVEFKTQQLFNDFNNFAI